jgi:hypothetical protein
LAIPPVFSLQGKELDDGWTIIADFRNDPDRTSDLIGPIDLPISDSCT